MGMCCRQQDKRSEETLIAIKNMEIMRCVCFSFSLGVRPPWASIFVCGRKTKTTQTNKNSQDLLPSLSLAPIVLFLLSMREEREKKEDCAMQNENTITVCPKGKKNMLSSFSSLSEIGVHHASHPTLGSPISSIAIMEASIPSLFSMHCLSIIGAWGR